jgi:ribosomal protein RSM22 (predicted rRNA methylase)
MRPKKRSDWVTFGLIKYYLSEVAFQCVIMDNRLRDFIQNELCPDGEWKLSDYMRSILERQISRLPKAIVSEDETRYPTTPAGMRAFLDVFFTRHYFQVQDSLLDYMVSGEFMDSLAIGELQILDVGCGPAVASLAITDMLGYILEYFRYAGGLPRNRFLNMTYVLNDTSGICLGTGQRMLTDYFRICSAYNKGTMRLRTICIQEPFPSNMKQLRRIRNNSDSYNIAVFSYVVVPVSEEEGLDGFVNGLWSIEDISGANGQILILQDKFQAALMQRISRAIGVSAHKAKLTQAIYSRRNANESYTCSYYRCLYAPRSRMIVKNSSVA